MNYEIRMLIFCSEHLDHSHSSPSSTPAGDHKNMALEAFLMHYRNLRGLLCPLVGKDPAVRETDVLASDFLQEPLPRNVGNVIVLARNKERLDQMLTHISSERDRYIAASDDDWPVGEMTIAMLKELKEFLALIPAYRNDFPPPSQIEKAIEHATWKLCE